MKICVSSPSLPCEAPSLDVIECIISPSLSCCISGLILLQRQSGGCGGGRGRGALDNLVLHAACPHKVLWTRPEESMLKLLCNYDLILENLCKTISFVGGLFSSAQFFSCLNVLCVFCSVGAISITMLLQITQWPDPSHLSTCDQKAVQALTEARTPSLKILCSRAGSREM